MAQVRSPEFKAVPQYNASGELQLIKTFEAILRYQFRQDDLTLDIDLIKGYFILTTRSAMPSFMPSMIFRGYYDQNADREMRFNWDSNWGHNVCEIPITLDKLDRLISNCTHDLEHHFKRQLATEYEKLLFEALHKSLKCTSTDPLPGYNDKHVLVCTVRGKKILGVPALLQYLTDQNPHGFPNKEEVFHPFYLKRRQRLFYDSRIIINHMESKEEDMVCHHFRNFFVDFTDLQTDIIDLITHPLFREFAQDYCMYQFVFANIPDEFHYGAYPPKTLAELSVNCKAAVTRALKHREKEQYVANIQKARCKLLFNRLQRILHRGDVLEFLEESWCTKQSLISTLSYENLHCLEHEYQGRYISIAELVEILAQKYPELESVQRQIENRDHVPQEEKLPAVEHPVQSIKAAQAFYYQHLINLFLFAIKENKIEHALKLIPLIPNEKLKAALDVHQLIAMNFEILATVLPLLKHCGFDWNKEKDKRKPLELVFERKQEEKAESFQQDVIKVLISQGAEFAWPPLKERFIDHTANGEYKRSLRLLADECYNRHLESLLMQLIQYTPFYVGNGELLKLLFSFICDRFDLKNIITQGPTLFAAEIDLSKWIEKGMKTYLDLFQKAELAEYFIIHRLLCIMLESVRNPDTTVEKLYEKIREARAALLKEHLVTSSGLHHFEKEPMFQNIMNQVFSHLKQRGENYHGAGPGRR